jgi:hypothetical protein
MHAMFADLAFQCRDLLLHFLTPARELAFLQPLFTLLFQLFGEFRQFTLTTLVQRPELIENNDRVRPFRINQQTFEMFELLSNSCCRALLFFDSLLQSILLLAKFRKLLLQLRPVLEEFDEFVVPFRSNQ